MMRRLLLGVLGGVLGSMTIGGCPPAGMAGYDWGRLRESCISTGFFMNDSEIQNALFGAEFDRDAGLTKEDVLAGLFRACGPTGSACQQCGIAMIDEVWP